MAKRSGNTDIEGPSSKMRREDFDDGGGRSGRVRKKSAKVLEMEEFEQVEKTHHAGKKSKTPKIGAGHKSEEDEVSAQSTTPGTAPKIKVKVTKALAVTPKSTLAANLMQAPISVTPAAPKSAKSGGALSAQLNKPVSHFVPVQTSGILTTTVKLAENPTDELAAVIKKEMHDDSQEDSEDSVTTPVAIKSEQPSSVIKYLLSSPASGSKTASGLAESGTDLVGGGGKKSTSKKSKLVQEKAGKATKSKSSAKQKLDMSSPTEADDEDNGEGLSSGAGLKMRISASSDPQSAQVTLNPKAELTEKGKKKKSKISPGLEASELASGVKMELKLEPEETGAQVSKKQIKKPSKKKEKLIQEVISAVNKVPASDDSHELSKKVKKKKKMIKLGDKTSPGESGEGDLFIDDADGESTLVIAEGEQKKKKSFRKKKPSLKGQPDSKEEDKEKKLSKRAPTAYMLFCNTHRPGIVNQNPGIEFAGISKKLGEMWQTLSTKQKLQWRRKAQRRMKKGSNLISTGKAAAAKDSTSQGPHNIVLLPPGGASTPTAGLASAASGIRYINALNRSPGESPQSPTKLNFSIEPVDVAAHLKLLGESLSIIGMRLQEHKGMIAVQGSLSVLLDSLLCACGPLLCLTQQVPDMDGCDPLVHGQTLDSVAYVMPGL
ncbi:HMG box-containing protein 4 [Elysia marginata]|uniref:HMG box-containing protein 4 n=1 Tax=Elysia marginata TaxID=1093978 RepID=A0AAV4G365_9GAST|nr:HMG box-containing protein 4 [Elysia marginata]